MGFTGRCSKRQALASCERADDPVICVQGLDPQGLGMEAGLVLASNLGELKITQTSFSFLRSPRETGDTCPLNFLHFSGL